MFLALQTVLYRVRNKAAAVEFYKKFLNVIPHADSDYYTGFTVGDGYGLGLLSRDGVFPSVVPSWEVGDGKIEETYERLIALGARPYVQNSQPIINVSGHDDQGPIWVAYLKDPFGLPIGLINHTFFPAKFRAAQEGKPDYFSTTFSGLGGVELVVENLNDVVGWYEKVLSLSATELSKGTYEININSFKLIFREKCSKSHSVIPYWRTQYCPNEWGSAVEELELQPEIPVLLGDEIECLYAKDPFGIQFSIVKDSRFDFDVNVLEVGSACRLKVK